MALTQMMMEKKEKVMAARAASAPCEKPLVSVVLCHWFARKQKATNHRKARKPAGEQSWSVLPLPSTSLLQHRAPRFPIGTGISGDATPKGVF